MQYCLVLNRRSHKFMKTVPALRWLMNRYGADQAQGRVPPTVGYPTSCSISGRADFANNQLCTSLPGFWLYIWENLRLQTPNRYLIAIVKRSLLLFGNERRSPISAESISDERGKAQIYHCSVHRLRPTAHRFSAGEARARDDPRDSASDQAVGRS